MYFKTNQLPFLLFIIFVHNCFFNLNVNAAGKSKSGKKMPTVSIPKDQQGNVEKINELSYKTPFRYHYCPWVTRKLLLTLNLTSTHTHFYSLDQISSVNTDDLEFDYECNDPSVLVRKKSLPLLHSINSDDYKDSKNLNCYERSFLQEIVKQQNNRKFKNHWTHCNELNRNTIKDVCQKADVAAERLKDKYVDEKGAHEELKSVFDNYSLKYCSKFILKDIVSSVNRQRLLNQIAYNGTCDNMLSELVQLDALVNFFSCEFDQILSRIYCQGYSVKETCDECSVSMIYYDNTIYII